VGIEALNADEINQKVSRYWSVSIVEETTSTQFDLSASYQSGKVLVAEYQSAGRGRLDREFIVPHRKGLTFSFCIDVVKDFGWIPLLAGLATARAINKTLGKEVVTLKWPNDLQINGKKLGGILSEKVASGVIVGIGINVWQSQSELPIAQAISLSMVAEVDRSALLIEILNELGSVLSNVEIEKENYLASCSTIGKLVQISLPNGETIEDIAVGIDVNGALQLKSRTVNAGDVIHLR